MISQKDHFVEFYTRKGNSLEWDYEVFEKEEDVAYFKGLNFSLPLRTIYEHIQLIPVAAEEEE